MLLPHREHAISVLRRRRGDRAEAEDCVHDAMLRLVERDDLDPERVGSLLTRAALAIAIDHARAAQRSERAATRLGGGAAAQVVSPDEVLADRVEAERVMAEVERLPRRERQVLLLRLTGFGVGETATRLGLSYKSVEGAYTRARARIRLALGGLLAWIAVRLRRVSSSRGEAAVATVAALLFAGPFWGGAPLGPPGGAGGAHIGHPPALAAAWPGPGAAPASRHSPSGPNGASGNGHGRSGDGGSSRPPVPSDRHSVSVPLIVPAPKPVGGPDILDTGITITYGPIKNLDPVGGVEDCIADGPTISVTQDFCPN
jgi:RNA polymerase sigma factor (sigma-70 family)